MRVAQKAQSRCAVDRKERVWEWLPNFDGANGDILSLYFQPYVKSSSSPTSLSGDVVYTSSSSSSASSLSASSSKAKSSKKRNNGRSDDEDEDDDNGEEEEDDGGGGAIVTPATPVLSDEGNLIIAGAFTNYPAVAIWVNDPKYGSRTVPVETDANPIVPGSGVGGITGLVTSVTPMLIPEQDRPHVMVYKDYTLAVIVTCVTMGVLLGILSAFLCHYHTYVPWLRAIAEGKQGIALQTLSYGIVPDLDIAESYARAMKVGEEPCMNFVLFFFGFLSLFLCVLCSPVRRPILLRISWQ